MEKILRSLIKDLENIVCVIEESKDLTMLSIEEFAGSLETHEQWRRMLFKPLDQELQAKVDLKGGARNTQGRGGLRGKG